MAKISLNNLTSISGNETSAINTINTNNDSIETASDNWLSRDGTAPNQMLSDFDMNSFRILNCIDAVNLSEPATYRQLLDLFGTLSSGGSLIKDMVAEVTMTGNGSQLLTGVQGDFSIPFTCVITGWTLLADVNGSLVIDIWKDTYANFPPVAGDTITGGNKPTLSTTNKNQDSTLTGWTTLINAGDILRFNIDSSSTITRAVLALTLRKTS